LSEELKTEACTLRLDGPSMNRLVSVSCSTHCNYVSQRE